MPNRYFSEIKLSSLLHFSEITIQCPDVPDADDIASAFALYEYFRLADRRITCFYSGAQPVERPNLVELLSQLSFPLEYRLPPRPCNGLLIMINCQPGSGNVTATQHERLAVLGRHTPISPMPELSDVRPHLSACSTLVWRLLKSAGHALSVKVASALIYALDVATNGFAEVRFPLDLDMRDELLLLLEDDRRMYDKLKRSNLSLMDLSLSARALDTLDYHVESRAALMGVLPTDPSIPRFLVNLALRTKDVDVAVAFSESASELRFSVSSGARETKALDLAKWFLIGMTGSRGGDSQTAGGRIIRLSGSPWPDSAFGFFRSRLNEYFSAYEIIDCVAGKKFSTQGMRAFQKLPVTLGYVPCAELFPEKSRLHIRMLEGDITIKTTPETYLMIGSSGEVYPIDRKVFEKSYLPSEQPQERRFSYSPAVLDNASMSRVELSAVARLCTSREGRVLARQLARGIKIFTSWDSENYFKGEPGDWLIMRKEDHADQYVITKDSFSDLYRPVRMSPA